MNKRRFRMLSVTLLILPMLGGCCGMTNVQASGGGGGGFASLGVLMLGSKAIQRLCDEDNQAEPEDAPLPPDSGEPTDSSFAESLSSDNG